MTFAVSWTVKSKTSTVSADRAPFCAAVYAATDGRPDWRMVDTMAKRLGVPFDEAEAIANECARLQWLDHQVHSVRLREEGRVQALRIAS